ncbi:MAG: TaqI-like C-terminal specificity domain-containing protein [Tuberibacillus sp.]
MDQSSGQQSSFAYLNINEAASLLSVSTATIRNWMKAGKLASVRKEGGTVWIDKNEAQAILANIASGQSHLLKSRRNKKAVSGNALPTEYVSFKDYIDVAEKILDWIGTLNDHVDPSLILHEVVLNLLSAQKRLAMSKTPSHLSLTEQFLNGQITLGSYKLILNELYEPTALKDHEKTLLRKIKNLNIPYLEGDDLLGLLYMALTNLGSRKNKGSYYTPSDICDQLIHTSLQEFDGNALPKAIDPCCGSGNFILRLFIILKDRLMSQGFAAREAEEMLLTDYLVGFDIDPTAVQLAKINLILSLRTPYECFSHVPMPIHCRNALLLQKDFTNRFELVIGNPPWGYHFSDAEKEDLKKRYSTASGSVESFSLFIEYGISCLKKNGILSFVLPESLLNVRTHETTRKILIENTQLCSIGLLGDRFSKVFAPSIILTARKALNVSADHIISIIQDHSNYTVLQRRFETNKGLVFNVRSSDKDHLIVEKMRSQAGIQYLENQADFALGIVTGNNRQFLLNQPGDGAEQVLKGSHIFKYHYSTGDDYLKFEPALFHQTAPEAMYRAKEKLIYRFINQNLVFAYDNKGMLSLNSANIVIPRIPGMSIKYILAVLNSRPAQFFYQISFSSIKVLRLHIESIPIPPVTAQVENWITESVDELMQTKHAEKRLALYEYIDNLIMGLYPLDAGEKEWILNKTAQVKYL